MKRDYSGERFERLFVIEKDTNPENKREKYWCQCDCGSPIRSVAIADMKVGDAKSCGCLNKEKLIKRNLAGLRDLTGLIFNKLTVLHRDENPINKNVHYICKCECGNTKSILGSNLTTGDIQSCGCMGSEKGWTVQVKEVDCYSRKREYKIWLGIVYRCTYEDNKNFHNYGGRGITVHKEWLECPSKFIDYVKSLENYNNGKRTIDRINNDGNYEPGNLRWATPQEQSQNTRKNVINSDIAKKIREMKYTNTPTEIAEYFDINIATVYGVLSNRTWKV